LTNTHTNEVSQVKLVDLVPSSSNPRGAIRKGDKTIAELAESIKGLGLLQPLVVRAHPKKKGKYEILAGARRYRALELAEVEMVPVLIYESDDTTAKAISIVENMQREDIDPMQEARAIEALRAKYKGDNRAVASVLGISQYRVARRAKLLDLSESWAGMKENDTDCPMIHWTPDMLELISRYDEHTQELLYEDLRDDYYTDKMARADLVKYLAESMRDLSKAPWHLDDAALLPEAGGCDACPKRSDRETDLFGDDGTPKDMRADARCLDPECWRKKWTANLDMKRAELQEEHKAVVIVAPKDRDEQTAEVYRSDDILQPSRYDEAKPNAKGARPAMIGQGPRAGQLVWIKTRADGTPGGSRKKQKGEVTTLEERRKTLDARRQVLAVNKLHDLIEEGDDMKRPPRSLDVVLSWIRAFGIDPGRGLEPGALHTSSPWDRLKAYQEQDIYDEEAVQHLWDMVKPVIIGELQTWGGLARAEQDFEEAVKWAEQLQVDFAQIHLDAIAEIPEPKSWAKLNEDGTPKAKAQKKGGKK